MNTLIINAQPDYKNDACQTKVLVTPKTNEN